MKNRKRYPADNHSPFPSPLLLDLYLPTFCILSIEKERIKSVLINICFVINFGKCFSKVSGSIIPTSSFLYIYIHALPQEIRIIAISLLVMSEENKLSCKLECRMMIYAGRKNRVRPKERKFAFISPKWLEALTYIYTLHSFLLFPFSLFSRLFLFFPLLYTYIYTSEFIYYTTQYNEKV